MLQFTDRQTGEALWINPQQVSAIIPVKQGGEDGCALLMAGGFELQIRETAEDVTSKVQKRLNAY